MKTIDPHEHRQGVTVQHPPAVGPDSTFRLATCNHHPEWGYQTEDPAELDQAISEHVRAHADGADVYPLGGALPAAQVRQDGTFTVQQALRLEAARMLFGQPTFRLRTDDSDEEMATIIRTQLDPLAAWITDRTVPKSKTPAAVVTEPTASGLDDVNPDDLARQQAQAD